MPADFVKLNDVLPKQMPIFLCSWRIVKIDKLANLIYYNDSFRPECGNKLNARRNTSFQACGPAGDKRGFISTIR